MRSNQSMKKLIVLSRALLAALALLVATGFLYERSSRAQALEEFPPAGQLFDTGQSRIHMFCLGDSTSSPVVLFEVGWRGSSLLWLPIMESLASEMRVCAYDRPGMVWSDFRHYSDYPKQAAAELDSLLQAAGVDQPLIIAAHSLGGAYARVFAGEYPDRVAALLLIDSVHHDMLNRVDRVDPSKLPLEIRYPTLTRWLGEIGVVRLIAKMELDAALERNPGLETMLRTKAAYAPNQVRGEAYEFNEAPKLHRQSASYVSPLSIPVVVVSRGLQPDPSDDKAIRHFAIWQQMQRELLGISENSR